MTNQLATQSAQAADLNTHMARSKVLRALNDVIFDITYGTACRTVAGRAWYYQSVHALAAAKSAAIS
jgi:hypothetical protein